ncbi:GATA transcription factor 15-like [Carica papaya]|uniref:GATA transcription factor 15-like n=1 Tax=Carica papaya TaxID=3649 RepID=UPI000B8D12AA|nr:GATA transcription factor 15-like [Carica papaya]
MNSFALVNRSGKMDTRNKSCADCHTTRTPLWRGGPAGPRSLCNACGIRYRKKRRVVLGVNRDQRGEKSQRKKSKDGVSFKLGEEEQAAFLLMALSCSSVFCA